MNQRFYHLDPRNGQQDIIRLEEYLSFRVEPHLIAQIINFDTPYSPV